MLAGDEVAVQLGAGAGYGWRPVGGGDTVSVKFSTRSVRMFGALASNRIHAKEVESTNSETFVDFLKDMRQTYGRFVMVLDNASYHKTDMVKNFVKGAGEDVRLIFLPPYTPQLSPIEGPVEGAQENTCRKAVQDYRRGRRRRQENNQDRRDETRQTHEVPYAVNIFTKILAPKPFGPCLRCVVLAGF